MNKKLLTRVYVARYREAIRLGFSEADAREDAEREKERVRRRIEARTSPQNEEN